MSLSLNIRKLLKTLRVNRWTKTFGEYLGTNTTCDTVKHIFVPCSFSVVNEAKEKLFLLMVEELVNIYMKK